LHGTAGLYKEGAGLAYGEEPETLWSILAKLAQVLKYCSTELRTVIMTHQVEHVCASRANNLPTQLLDKYTRATASEKRAKLQAAALSQELVKIEAVGAAVLAAPAIVDSEGLPKKLRDVFYACNKVYPPDVHGEEKSPPVTVDRRTQRRNKYVLLLEQLHAADEASLRGEFTTFNKSTLEDEVDRYGCASKCRVFTMLDFLFL